MPILSVEEKPILALERGADLKRTVSLAVLSDRSADFAFRSNFRIGGLLRRRSGLSCIFERSGGWYEIAHLLNSET